jgi:hypothetical protein
MRREGALLCVVGAALTLSPAACAELVGADFDDVHPADVNAGSPDAATLPPPARSAQDSGPRVAEASIPVIPADGGACPTGLTDCSGLCVDLTNDPAHCGSCTTVCPNDPHGPGVCVTDTCAYACEAGWLRCAAGCCAVTFPDASTSEDDAAPDVDSGPSDPGIACGDTYCSVARQNYCCGGNGAGDICVSATSTDDCPWEITCDNAAECGPGLVCCYDNAPNVTQSMCQTSCGGANQLQFCTTSAECLGGAGGTGTSCTGTFTANGLETSYSYCK